MSWVKLGVCFFLFSFSQLCSANEGKSSPEGAAANNQAYSGKQDQNWEVVQTELAALKTKLDAQSVTVQSLIEQKAQLKGEALMMLVEDIKKQHQKYEGLVLDYNKKNDEFLTRYPERGLKEKRVYKRVKIKSLHGFEAELTTKDHLQRVHNKILNQYPGVVDSQRSTSATGKAKLGRKEKPVQDVTKSIELKK